MSRIVLSQTPYFSLRDFKIFKSW